MNTLPARKILDQLTLLIPSILIARGIKSSSILN